VSNKKLPPTDVTQATNAQGTSVSIDLGDDLLEKTIALPGTPATPEPEQPLDAANEYHSARILFQEGLTEEAKRLLHQILLLDPDFHGARELLEQIHAEELRQLFSEETGRRVSAKERKQQSETLDADTLLEKLDSDLELGLFEAGSMLGPPVEHLELLSNPQELESLTHKIDSLYAQSNPQDRVDIGIALMELGMTDLAIRQFEKVCSDRLGCEKAFLISTTGLIGTALLLSGRPFDAISRMAPLINDSDVPIQEKLDLMYLTARAHEAIGRADLARGWYHEVLQADPKYRDAARRLAKSERK